MKTVLGSFLLLALLSSCGGSSDNDGTPQNEDPNTIISVPDKTESFEVIGTNHNAAVQNFYLLVTLEDLGEESLTKFALDFKGKYCSGNCNIDMFDSKEIKHLLGKYPLEGDEYLLFADHFIAHLIFEIPDKIFMYPYQDAKYKELGGKNWKKEPVQ